jgi:hypothetical protein
MEPSRICICVPYFGGKDWEHAELIEQAKSAGYLIERLHNYPYIDQARCLLTERALKHDIDVVFFIDHDMIFDVEDILSMAKEAINHNAVVSGLYLTRRAGGTAVVRLDPIPEKLLCFKAGGLYACSGLPGGFTAIPRSILEEMTVRRALLPDGKTLVRLWFFNDVYWPESLDYGVWLGEDSAFSKRLGEAGNKMFVDTRPRIFHKGAHKFALEDGDMSYNVKFKDVLEITMSPI